MSKFDIVYNKIFKNLYMTIPLLQLLLLELFSHRIRMCSVPFLLNVGIFYALFLILLVICGHKGLPVVITSVLWGGIGLANAMLLQFRQTPILPWDLLSVKTALSVSSGYHLVFTSRIILTLVCYIVLVILGFYLLKEKAFKTPKKRIISLIITLFLSVILIIVVPLENLSKYIFMNTVSFYPDIQFSENGFAFSFLRDLKDIKVKKPEGYNAENEEKTIKNAKNISKTKKKPNIIVIMNEAFSDLTVLDKDLKTNKEVLPFINSLETNMVKGKAIVSVKGGNTANSEFEFLTSMPVSFYPSGTLPYQQYIKNDVYSMADYLEQFNYDTYAFHPAAKTNWNRNTVYPYLGFNNCFFSEVFSETEIDNTNSYRGLISDKTAYDYLVKHYESRDKSKNFFEFCVTLQNHGSYGENMSAGFKPDIVAPEYDSYNLNTYLSLINKSDEAFKNLTEYFKDKEPTVILMFGDHQPADEVTSVLKGSSSELDKYTVPYVLWANYDIDVSINYETTSLNYLSLLLYEKAGISTDDDFHKEISDFRKKYPVISTHGIVDNKGKVYDYNEIDNSVDFLKYRSLNYYLVLEKKTR